MTISAKLGFSACNVQWPFISSQALDCQFPVQGANDDLAWHRLNGAVNHQDIIVVDARIEHGLALRPRKKGRGGLLHQQLVQVQGFLDKVIWRVRENPRTPCLRTAATA